MIMTIDGEWLARNAPLVLDVAAAEAGLEFHRGDEFLKRLDDMEKPNMENREFFRGIFDGRYKLVRYFGMANYNLPGSVEDLLADNDVALYDLQKDPTEVNNLAIPDNPDYDDALLAAMNAKLNALIDAEIGEDKILLERPEEQE
jgi:hypothetical protein